VQRLIGLLGLIGFVLLIEFVGLLELLEFIGLVELNWLVTSNDLHFKLFILQFAFFIYALP
jgi:hypothetical protein